jgi:ribonuclease D
MSSQKRKRNDRDEERMLPSMEPSQWQIPSSSENTGTYWTHQMYRGPRGQKVRIVYCRTLEECDVALERLSGFNVLGFDIEWKTMGGGRIKDQVSVVQLASDAEIIIIHLAGFPGEALEDLLSPALKLLLENPNIIKVGHNITGDGTRLRKHLLINPQGFTEVSGLKLEIDPPLSDRSLKTLVETFFKLEFDKGLATSGWHQSKPLTQSQLRYAGADAYAGLKLFQYFASLRDSLTVTIIDYEAREGKKSRPDRLSLLDKLKQLRSQCTTDERKNVLSFASNDVLNRIVAEPPTAISSLRQIRGIKSSTVKKHGRAILDLIQEHHTESPQTSWPSTQPSNSSQSMISSSYPSSSSQPTYSLSQPISSFQPFKSSPQLTIPSSQDSIISSSSDDDDGSSDLDLDDDNDNDDNDDDDDDDDDDDTSIPTTADKIYSQLYFLRQRISDQIDLLPQGIATDELLQQLAEVRPASQQALEDMGADLFDDLATENEGVSILDIFLDA